MSDRNYQRAKENYIRSHDSQNAELYINNPRKLHELDPGLEEEAHKAALRFTNDASIKNSTAEQRQRQADDSELDKNNVWNDFGGGSGNTAASGASEPPFGWYDGGGSGDGQGGQTSKASGNPFEPSESTLPAEAGNDDSSDLDAPADEDAQNTEAGTSNDETPTESTEGEPPIGTNADPKPASEGQNSTNAGVNTKPGPGGGGGGGEKAADKLKDAADDIKEKGKDLAENKVKKEAKKALFTFLLENPEVLALVIAGIIILTFVIWLLLYTFAIAYPGDDCKDASGGAASTSIVVIDPGHPSELDTSNSLADYAKDKLNWETNQTGATGGTSGNGVVEREVNQQVAKYLQTELTSKGYDAILTKDNANTFMSNYDRGQLAKEKKADIIIKLHNDGDGPVPGMVFYTSNPDVIKSKWDVKGANNEYVLRRKDSTIDKDAALAKALNEAFDAAKLKYSSGSAYPSEVREHPSNAGFGYTYDIPTSLVEMASLKQAKDAAFIKTAENQKKVAKAIAVGVATYLPKSNATVTNLGDPNSAGYYQLPKSSYYTRNANGGSPPSQQWGGKTLINTLLAVGQTWSNLHPNDKFSVGDLNAPGHKSHKTGIDADIYSTGKLFMSLPGHADNPNYDRSLAIELAKTFMDTGTIDTIFYYDQEVVTAVNKYANEKKLSGKMSLLSQHDDHFHVRVVDGKDPLTTATATGSSKQCTEEEAPTTDSADAPANLDGDLTALRKTWTEYRKAGKITKQSIGDIDGDVANGKVRAQTIKTALQMADYLDSKKKGPLQISVMKTGHKPGTLHWVGLAFDIGNESVAKTLMPWAYANADTLNLDELIYDNSAIGVGSNKYNLKNGKQFNYSSSTLSGHTNHIHVGVYVDE